MRCGLDGGEIWLQEVSWNLYWTKQWSFWWEYYKCGFLISASDIVLRKLTKIFTFYFAVCVSIAVVGTLSFNDATATRTSKKKKTPGLICQTTTSRVHHTFLYISLPFLHHYDVKMPNFAFYGERKQATTKFYFSFWTWMRSLGIQPHEVSSTFD